MVDSENEEEEEEEEGSDDQPLNKKDTKKSPSNKEYSCEVCGGPKGDRTAFETERMQEFFSSEVGSFSNI